MRKSTSPFILSRATRALHAAFLVLRPIFGPRKVCIYPFDCSDYIPQLFYHYPFMKACWFAGIRLLSCNPLMGWYLWHRGNKK